MKGYEANFKGMKSKTLMAGKPQLVVELPPHHKKLPSGVVVGHSVQKEATFKTGKSG